MARAFAQRLPLALDELQRECNCLVILRTAVAGPTPNTIDLAAQLREGSRAMNSEPVQPALPRAGSIPGRGGESSNDFADFLRHVRRRWYLYLPILAIWGLAYARLLGTHCTSFS